MHLRYPPLLNILNYFVTHMLHQCQIREHIGVHVFSRLTTKKKRENYVKFPKGKIIKKTKT